MPSILVLATVGYIAMQVLVEGIKKANSAKSDDVAKALLV